MYIKFIIIETNTIVETTMVIIGNLYFDKELNIAECFNLFITTSNLGNYDNIINWL